MASECLYTGVSNITPAGLDIKRAYIVNKIILHIKAGQSINDKSLVDDYRYFLGQEVSTSHHDELNENALRLKEVLENNMTPEHNIKLHLPVQISENDQCWLIAEVCDKVYILTFYFYTDDGKIMTVEEVPSLSEAHARSNTPEIMMLRVLANCIVNQKNVSYGNVAEIVMDPMEFATAYTEFWSKRMNKSMDSYNAQVFIMAIRHLLDEHNRFLKYVTDKNQFLIPDSNLSQSKVRKHYFMLYNLIKKETGGSTMNVLKGVILRESGVILEFCDIKETSKLSKDTKFDEENKFFEEIAPGLVDSFKQENEKAKLKLDNIIQNYLNITYNTHGNPWHIVFDTLMKEGVGKTIQMIKQDVKLDNDTIDKYNKIISLEGIMRTKHKLDNIKMIDNLRQLYRDHVYTVERIKKVNMRIIKITKTKNEYSLHEVKSYLLKLQNKMI